MGVLSVESGYAGGSTEHPTYEEVCSGDTGHAEVIRVTFDPERVSLERILAVFLAAHDPTTLNRQGADTGTQYRSIILWTDVRQKESIERILRAAQAEYSAPIVTEVGPLKAFTPAEVTHRRYYDDHPEAAYCALIIAPKLQKLAELFRGSDGAS